MAIYFFRNAGTDWNTAANWSLTDGGGATGVVPLATDDAYFTSNSGSCTVSTATRVCKTLIFSGVGAGNYANTFTLNNTLTVSGNITLSSAMTFAGTSTITINATSTITTNTKVFTCNIIASGTITLTLGDDVYIGGNLSFGTVVGTTVTINGNTLYCGGSLTGSGNTILGTSNITMNGSGTLSVTAFSSYLGGSGTFTFNTTGTINISTHTFLSSVNRTIQYIAGNVFVPRGQTLSFTNATGIISLDLKGVKIYGSVSMAQGSISLVSDLIIDGGTFATTGAIVLNSSGGNLYLGDQSIPSSISGGGAISGTATIYIKGNGVGSFSCASAISSNIIFDFSGILTIINGILFGSEQVGMNLSSGTYTFLNGRIKSISFSGTNIRNQGTISITGNATLIGFDKFSGVGNIQITNAVTLTMDKFFSGRPDCISKVFCATTTGAYTITFRDTFEKFANWVKVSNCTLTRRGQLLILNQKATTNIGRNTGVRYNNVWPNGIAKDSPIIPNPPMAYATSGLLSDPTSAL
jgi:hypothetical protein